MEELKNELISEAEQDITSQLQIEVSQVVQQLTEAEGEEQAEVFSEILNEAEAGTIAIALHLVDDGQFRIAGPDEIAVQAVAQTALFHSAAGGHQRLRNHLAAINSDPSLIGGLIL